MWYNTQIIANFVGDFLDVNAFWYNKKWMTFSNRGSCLQVLLGIFWMSFFFSRFVNKQQLMSATFESDRAVLSNSLSFRSTPTQSICQGILAYLAIDRIFCGFPGVITSCCFRGKLHGNAKKKSKIIQIQIWDANGIT